eukprot:8438768-Lingulodinium_polyedra.AAC.1
MRPVTAAQAHDVSPRTQNPRGAPPCGSSTGAPPTGAIRALVGLLQNMAPRRQRARPSADDPDHSLAAT